jgi:class 3 adenylate cyclase/predicted metal-dependent HD superfamily phosphohydrolase
MERFINILVIDQDPTIRNGLKEILSGGGNNVLLVDSIEKAMPIIEQKEIGIMLVNIDDSSEALEKLESIRKRSLFKHNYIIIITKEDSPGIKLVRGINQGAVDYLTYPFNPNLVRSKIEVYKSLFHKDQRIGQLLSNIFPPNVLEEFSNTGKFSPKRIQNGVVLFTDFVDFSSKAKKLRPLQLIRKLERYFTEFDNIIEKYNLEKIKTIGDAYMALAGVTEGEPEPAIRACLAAIEMRDFMRNERDIAIALKKDFWEIRIGLHMGPLVAGIIGASKYTFDVWGDTVNIGARAEAATKRGHITITSTINNKVGQYFESHTRGDVEIHKRGGSLEMFYLDKIRPEYCLYGEGNSANAELRQLCGLPTMDFQHLRKAILNRLKSLLPENIKYHDIPHTLNVEKAAIRYAKLEGVSDSDILLLRTAVLFHDAGFILQYDHNEDFAVSMANSMLPEFGYSIEQIDVISGIINATKSSVEPTNILERIMCDADHDYLGRPDYHSIARKLREELEFFSETFQEKEWIKFQLEFLENKHKFYTETAQNIRQYGKNARIRELKKKLEEVE